MADKSETPVKNAAVVALEATLERKRHLLGQAEHFHRSATEELAGAVRSVAGFKVIASAARGETP